MARMRLLAAGSYSNLIWAFFFLLIIFNMGPLLSIGFNSPSGAYIYDIQSGSPASGVLEVGDVIIGLNDTEIQTWNSVSVFMADSISNNSLTIHTLRGDFVIELAPNAANSTRGYIGVYGADFWEPKPGFEVLTPMFAFHFIQIVTWTFIILFSVALFNLLPIPMLDGDKLLSNALSLRINDERKIKYIMWPARILSLTIIILSIGLTFLTGKALF